MGNREEQTGEARGGGDGFCAHKRRVQCSGDTQVRVPAHGHA